MQYEEDLIQFDTPLRFRNIKLPPFWSNKPSSWFALVESRFRTHCIVGEQAKFDQLVGLSARRTLGEFWTWWRCLLSSIPTRS